MTLETCWNGIEETGPGGRVRYFLRNHWAICCDTKSTLAELVDFLATRATLVCHRPGCYSIDGDGFHALFRINPTTPGPRGPIAEPSIVVTHFYLTT